MKNPKTYAEYREMAQGWYDHLSDEWSTCDGWRDSRPCLITPRATKRLMERGNDPIRCIRHGAIIEAVDRGFKIPRYAEEREIRALWKVWCDGADERTEAYNYRQQNRRDWRW